MKSIKFNHAIGVLFQFNLYELHFLKAMTFVVSYCNYLTDVNLQACLKWG